MTAAVGSASFSVISTLKKAEDSPGRAKSGTKKFDNLVYGDGLVTGVDCEQRGPVKSRP